MCLAAESGKGPPWVVICSLGTLHSPLMSTKCHLVVLVIGVWARVVGIEHVCGVGGRSAGLGWLKGKMTVLLSEECFFLTKKKRHKIEFHLFEEAGDD